MKVLLTGGLGDVGHRVVGALKAEGHSVRVLELRSPQTELRAAALPPDVEVFWADLRDAAAVMEAAQGCEAILHMAFVIPPLSEAAPDLARDVNIGGTSNIVAAATAIGASRLLFASSYHVHRYDPARTTPLTPDAPVEPSDHYAEHKIAAEALIREAGVPWTILRMSSVWLDRKPNAKNLRLMYDIPLDTRMETAHPDDLAVAFARAIGHDDLVEKTLFVGGGPGCQTTYRELYARIFSSSGLRELPDAAFTTRPFIGDWLDTSESQALLNYQNHDLTELIEARRPGRVTRAATRLLAPLIQRWMLRHSPHWSRG